MGTTSRCSRGFKLAFAALAAAVAVGSGCGGSDEPTTGIESGGGAGVGGAAGGSAAAAGQAGSSSGGTSSGGTSSGGTSSGGTSSGGASGSPSDGAGGSGADASAGSAGTSAGGTAGTPGEGGPCVVTPCQGHTYECGDCIDNDGNGDADMADPDCLGPCHNSETKYTGCISGQQNAPCKQDCYFDQDTGPGNDQCYWSHECDPLEVAPDYPPEGPGCAYDANANVPGSGQSCDELYQAQSDDCETICGPLTPNGCDCFGCCELPAGSGNTVYLGSTADDSGKCGEGTCDLDHATDPDLCHPCTQVKGCLNPCDKCELCLGKPTLPPECYPDAGGGTGGTGGTGTGGTSGLDGGGTSGTGGTGTSGTGGTGGTGGGCPTPLCLPNIQPCGVSCLEPCPTGYFCLTGCCQQIPT